jgi:hypothetical protein
MDMKPVKSSNVQAVGYDPASRTMRVQFNSGTYDYADVAPEKHADLMAADSLGKHLHAHFKGQHETTPVHAVEETAETSQ